MIPPEKLRLLFSMASRTSRIVMSKCRSMSGSSSTWNWRTNPPRLMTYDTPGTPCNW